MYQKPNERLKNQTAIVTGGSSGIGKAVAEALALDGANVVVNYHKDAESANQMVKVFNSDDRSGDAIAIQANVSVEKDVKRLFKKTVERFGTVDILIANAGIQIDRAFHKMTLTEWQKVIGVNLTGQFLCAREAIIEFLRRGIRPEVSQALGKIIHMSSVHEVIPWAGHANYAASKGGLVMLMQSLCQEYGPQKLRVNSIAPGAIKTPINKSAWSNPESLEKLNKLIPYKRIGQPSDIGSAAVWLASDESDYVNGTTLFIDGGMTCYPGFTENG